MIRAIAKAFDGVDVRLHIPLLFHSCLTQTAGNLIRVTIVYRALELELSIILLGLITATYALLPAFLAIPLGRFMDRGHDSSVCWMGTSLKIVASLGFILVPPSAASLFLFTGLFGLGHMFNIGATQIVCVRSARADRRDFAFGNYMIANSIGHTSGPLILSFAALGTASPPTQFLFIICAALTSISLLIAFLMRPAPRATQKKREEAAIPMAELLRKPGIPVLLAIGIITVTAIDLMPVYLPVLGKETGIAVFHIGLILTTRSIASLVARIFFSTLVYRFGRQRMFVASLLISTIGFGTFALPVPVEALYGASVLFGFGMGLATTLSVTSLVNAAPAEARATVISLRMFGNRIAQIALPALAGLLASVTGAAGVFAVLATGLAAATHTIQKHPSASNTK